MATLFENGDYVGFPPLLGDGGLLIGGPEYGRQDRSELICCLFQ